MLFTDHLIRELSKLQQPGLREMNEALNSIGCTREQIAPYVTEPDQLPYGRNVLYRSGDVEAIVVHIPAYQKTFIHDHGVSIGLVQLLEGSILNTVYTLNDNGEAAYVSQAGVREGQRIAAPAGQVHQMINTGNRRAVSLHLYTPPLADAKSYKQDEEYVLDYVI